MTSPWGCSGSSASTKAVPGAAKRCKIFPKISRSSLGLTWCSPGGSPPLGPCQSTYFLYKNNLKIRVTVPDTEFISPGKYKVSVLASPLGPRAPTSLLSALSHQLKYFSFLTQFLKLIFPLVLVTAVEFTFVLCIFSFPKQP